MEFYRWIAVILFVYLLGYGVKKNATQWWPLVTLSINGILFYGSVLLEGMGLFAIEHHIWSTVLRLHMIITIIGMCHIWSTYYVRK